MTTHDSLAMQISGNSCYETRFQKMLCTLQTDPSLLRLFLDNPALRLAGMGIPVMKSLEDIEFVSSCSEDADPSSGLLQIKLHWWGVDAVVGIRLLQSMQDDPEVGGGFEPIIATAIKHSLDGEGVDTICRNLKRFVGLTGNNKESIGKKNHWRVPWILWSTGLPLKLLLHFASRQSSC